MLSAAPRGRVAAGLAGRMGGMGTGRRLPLQLLQPLQPPRLARLARPLGAWAAGASDSGSVRKLADTLDRDPELTMALVEALSKESKIKMANAILDQETKTGIKYSNYLSNKHRRKIMIREISISMNDDIKEKIDVNNDGHVSTEELNHFLDNLIKVQGDTPENGEPATRKQLVQLALLAGIPFVGFGAVDNGIMLIAGDMIDLSLGRALGISTLAAAGLGNLISDVAGIGLGGYIEASSKQLGLKDPRLTLTQMNQRMVRIVQFLATALGISIGCLIGMLPLLFMDPEGPTFKKMWKAVVADDVSSTVKVGDLVPMVDTAVETLGPENRQTIVSRLRESFPSPESDVSLAQFRAFITELRSSKVIVPLGPMEQFSAELCDMLREEA